MLAAHSYWNRARLSRAPCALHRPLSSRCAFCKLVTLPYLNIRRYQMRCKVKTLCCKKCLCYSFKITADVGIANRTVALKWLVHIYFQQIAFCPILREYTT